MAALWTAINDHHTLLDPLFTLRRGGDAALRELLRSVQRDADSAIFVWDERGDLPGMCIVCVERAPPILEETRRAEITDLGVRESHRRRGIGRALVDAALGWVSEGGTPRVEVRVAHGNAEGQAFWRALGFGDLMDVLHKRL